jgi:asparagine N-glycosylation enzyme membrane subunit Stt3
MAFILHILGVSIAFFFYFYTFFRILMNMSLLYSKRTRNVIKWFWAVISVLIIFSMIVAYAPGILY